MSAGHGAVLSHRTAAGLYGLLRSTEGPTELTSPRQLRPRREIIAHRAGLAADEVCSYRGIPATTVVRSLFDLAAVAPRHQLEYAINQAEYRRLGGRLSLADLLARHPGVRGAATLRAIIAAGGLGERVTRSELEDRFLDFLRRRGLPMPEVNVNLELGASTIETDCLWRVARLIAELDGRDTHDLDDAFERDRLRDRLLLVEGWRTTRVTWHELHRHPDRLAAHLGALLARPARAA